MCKNFYGRGKEVVTPLLTAVWLLLFLSIGWRYFRDERAHFPIFYTASVYLDGYLEQTKQGESLYRAVGNFLHEAFLNAQTY